MNDGAPNDSARRIAAGILRIRSRLLKQLDGVAEVGTEKTIVDVLVECLEVHAKEYLQQVEDEHSASNYIKDLRRVGAALFENAEQHSVLADPYRDAKLRRIAESEIDFLRRKRSLSPAQQHELITKAVPRIREQLRPKADEWQAWKADTVFQIDARFEAVYLHWEAEALDRVRDREASAALRTDAGAKTADQPVTSDGNGEPAGQRARNWQGIEIWFTSEERATIRDGARTETDNYSDLGFEDKRNGKPNRAWEVLRMLAENHGTLPRGKSTAKAWAATEKRIQEIRKTLCARFGLPGDPLPLVTGSAYQAVFTIGCAPSYDY
jgi:hypothetical protein